MNYSELFSNLTYLNCQFVATNEQKLIHNLEFQQSILCWLEDRKIRCLDIEERGPLKQLNEAWNDAVKSYFEGLDCPFTWEKQNNNSVIPRSNFKCLLWLSLEAISLDFEDDMESSMVIAEDVGSSVNHLQNIATKLQLTQNNPNGDDVSAQIRFIQILINWLALHPAAKKDELMEEVNRTIKNFSMITGNWMGSSTTSVAEVSDVLRMLYLSDFRELQNDANNLMVIAQDYTANPKLNSALGKTGR